MRVRVVLGLVVCRSGKATVRLLTAKSRVPPLKTETIPRFELLENLLLANLITSVKNLLKNCLNFAKFIHGQIQK